MRRFHLLPLVAGLGLSLPALAASATAQTLTPQVIQSPNDLLALDESQLQALYSAPTSTAVAPTGPVRGMVIVAPGRPRNRVLSRGSRLVWQGKLMYPQEGRATNFFFAVPSIRGQLYTATSLIDGQPTVVLDYQDTSRVFARYFDEFRLVAPNLYLGYMFDRSTNPPTRVRTFLLDSR